NGTATNTPAVRYIRFLRIWLLPASAVAPERQRRNREHCPVALLSLASGNHRGFRGQRSVRSRGTVRFDRTRRPVRRERRRGLLREAQRDAVDERRLLLVELLERHGSGVVVGVELLDPREQLLGGEIVVVGDVGLVGARIRGAVLAAFALRGGLGLLGS